MIADRSCVDENRARRERLNTLVGRLGDRGLAMPMPDGWTVAAVSARVAFRDRRIVVPLDARERAGNSARRKPLDRGAIDWINDSAKVLAPALPPRVAAELAMTVDARLAALGEGRLAADADAGRPIDVVRAAHHREHLDAIGT
jgi:hypothetical protein